MTKSIGKIYPLTISYKGKPGEGGWYVWHTLTGRWSSLSWPTCDQAHRYAEEVLSGECPRTAYQWLFNDGPEPVPSPVEAEVEEQQRYNTTEYGARVGHGDPFPKRDTVCQAEPLWTDITVPGLTYPLRVQVELKDGNIYFRAPFEASRTVDDCLRFIREGADQPEATGWHHIAERELAKTGVI